MKIVGFAIGSSVSLSNGLQCCVVIDTTQRESGEEENVYKEQHSKWGEELQSQGLMTLEVVGSAIIYYNHELSSRSFNTMLPGNQVSQLQGTEME